MPQKTIILGIDPGNLGALCFMTDDGNILLLKDMPTIKYEMSTKRRVKGKLVPKIKTEIDIKCVAELLARYEPDIVYIERVGAMPGQGVVSMFSFGFGYGMLVGLMRALEGALATVQVSPQSWQKSICKDAPGETSKQRAIYMAEALYPGQAGKSDGRADAILIAEYGRRQLKLN